MKHKSVNGFYLILFISKRNITYNLTKFNFKISKKKKIHMSKINKIRDGLRG
jgi:hypothetical protein